MAKTASMLIGAALAAMAASASAQPSDQALSRYRAAAAAGPTETLVLCDTTAFLATKPNLDADLIIARREGRPAERLRSPYFVAGGFLYRQGYEQLFHKLSQQGSSSRTQLAQAQEALGRGLIDVYRRQRHLPTSFEREQLAYCSRFAKSHGVNADW